MERDRAAFGASAPRRAWRGRARLFCPQLSFLPRRSRGPPRDHGLRRAAGGGDRGWECRGHPIPSRKEPGGGAAADRIFLALAPMSDMRAAGTVSVDRLTKFSGTDL